MAKSDGYVVQVTETDLQKHRDGHVFTGSGHPDFAASVQPDGGLDRLLQRISRRTGYRTHLRMFVRDDAFPLRRDDGSLDALADEGEGIAAAVHGRAPHRLLPQPLLQAPFLMMVRRQRQREGRSGHLSTGSQRESGLLRCSVGLLAKRLLPGAPALMRAAATRPSPPLEGCEESLRPASRKPAVQGKRCNSGRHRNGS